MQLELDDHVKIQIPGEPEKTERIIDLGFRTATTKAAEVFNALLDKGKYLSINDNTRDLVKQVEAKLQKYFKSKEN